MQSNDVSWSTCLGLWTTFSLYENIWIPFCSKHWITLYDICRSDSAIRKDLVGHLLKQFENIFFKFHTRWRTSGPSHNFHAVMSAIVFDLEDRTTSRRRSGMSCEVISLHMCYRPGLMLSCQSLWPLLRSNRRKTVHFVSRLFKPLCFHWAKRCRENPSSEVKSVVSYKRMPRQPAYFSDVKEMFQVLLRRLVRNIVVTISGCV